MSLSRAGEYCELFYHFIAIMEGTCRTYQSLRASLGSRTEFDIIHQSVKYVEEKKLHKLFPNWK